MAGSGRDPRRPLAALRYGANLSVDGPSAAVAAVAKDAVLRHATTGPDGAPRLSALGAAMASAEVRRLLLAQEPGLVTELAAWIAAAEALAEQQAKEAIGGKAVHEKA